ncbi:MAG: hypothetical protein CMM58_02990 [Rhodospirillaceae bacterium]|nr:hypothetical protein [Rhodospirillaceae bacterium]
MTDKYQTGYDAYFIDQIFKRLHGHSISKEDTVGLSNMLKPIDELADTAAEGLNFDDEPADFERLMDFIRLKKIG